MESFQKVESQVSHVAKDLPELPGTTVKRSFIMHRQDSWQNHLQRISPFLIAGEGVWWTQSSKFHFHDGAEDCARQDDFTLLHFRQQSIVDVEERRKSCWNAIVTNRVPIPTTEVKVYDIHGTRTGRIQYSEDNTVTFVPLPANTSPDTNSPFPCERPVGDDDGYGGDVDGNSGDDGCYGDPGVGDGVGDDGVGS